MSKTVCSECQDTGWVFVIDKDGERVRPCHCLQVNQDMQALQEANIPPRFQKMQLSSYKPDPHDPSQKKALKACERFIAEYPAVGDKGLLLQGPVGVGKTRLVCCIAFQLLQMKKASGIYYIDWNDLVREMKSGEDHSTRDFFNIDQLISRLASVELLIFDELGVSRPSPWVLDNIYYLINKRYNNNRLTLFASNYLDEKIDDQETLSERIGVRTRSRIFEMAETILIKGPDHRHKYG